MSLFGFFKVWKRVWATLTYRDSHPKATLRMIKPPTVHSLSTTTANLEWITALLAVCELAWGETPDCNTTTTFEVNYFGSYSLTGLKPGTTYYFLVRNLQVPRELADVFDTKTAPLIDEAISFTTLQHDSTPQTYYVATDGDDANTGLSRKQAWRTIAYAAARVNVGDTVQIAEGTYMERVRIRATGTASAPITFAAIPGEKVILAGADKRFNQAFVAGGKSHLRFDGFYFHDFSGEPRQGWHHDLAANFNLYRCLDIQITRCFSDGRGLSPDRFITAWRVEDLIIQNCVMINKMSGSMLLYFCPGLRVEHCVIARPQIQSFILRNESDQTATMTQNIFTDMLKKKADLNIPLFAVDKTVDGFLQKNNSYYLRSFPTGERMLINKNTLDGLSRHIIDPLFSDPQFRGDNSPSNIHGLDRMMQPGPLDFDDFYTTNPQMIERGIGLQPEEFKAYNFDVPSKTMP